MMRNQEAHTELKLILVHLGSLFVLIVLYPVPNLNAVTNLLLQLYIFEDTAGNLSKFYS